MAPVLTPVFVLLILISRDSHGNPGDFGDAIATAEGDPLAQDNDTCSTLRLRHTRTSFFVDERLFPSSIAAAATAGFLDVRPGNNSRSSASEASRIS